MATLEALEFSFLPLADARTVQLLATSLCLVAALLLAAIIIALVSRWRRQRHAEEDSSPHAQLAQFRALYEAGTITEEEFERLRALLGARLRDNLGVHPKVEPSLREGDPTRGASRPPSEPSQPPPDKPDTGIRPA